MPSRCIKTIDTKLSLFCDQSKLFLVIHMHFFQLREDIAELKQLREAAKRKCAQKLLDDEILKSTNFLDKVGMP